MNPYEKDLGGRDPITVLREGPERVRTIVEQMGDDDLRRPYAPGKWTAAQLLEHLAQVEMMFAIRIRMALTEPGYVVQPFDQDRFMAREPAHGPREALEMYLTLRRWNLPLYASLSEEERERTFTHPERGEMKVGDLVSSLAGHELHHVAQIEQTGR